MADQATYDDECEGYAPGQYRPGLDVWMARCSQCRVLVTADQIVEVEDTDNIVHGLCPPCLGALGRSGQLPDHL